MCVGGFSFRWVRVGVCVGVFSFNEGVPRLKSCAMPVMVPVSLPSGRGREEDSLVCEPMSLSQDASVDGARTGQAAYPALVLRAFNLERRAQQRCSSFEVLVGFCCGCKRWGRCWVLLGEFCTG